MINFKNSDSNLLKIDNKSYNNIDILYIKYITMKNIRDYESIHSVKPLYFILCDVDKCIVEKNGKDS